MSKNPKVSQKFDVTKTPKINENPANYKSSPVSWQICHIDNESNWGLSVLRDSFKFRFGDELLSKLPDGLSNKILDALTDLDNKEYKSINDFLEKLHQKCADSLNAEVQKQIISSFAENLFWTEIYPKLRHFETSTWESIEKEQFGNKGKTKHHSVSVSKIIPAAKKRLEKMSFDDIDELFSMRLSGELRIWGIRQYSFLRILWLDLHHEICPPNKQ